MKILIWGTGVKAKEYLSRKEVKEEDVIGFIESSPANTELRSDFPWKGTRKIYHPEDIGKLEYDYIFVCIYTSEFVNEIADICTELGIMDGRIIFMRNIRGITVSGDALIYYNKYQDNAKLEKIFPVFLKEFKEIWELDSWVLSMKNGSDALGNSLLDLSDFHGYHYDYFRYRTFEFVADEIRKKKVAGDVAEVGVFQGEFSKIINYIFSDRTLYMFDTFESFDRQELADDGSPVTGNDGFYQFFKNTSAEKVMEIMPCKEKCVIRKGFFPDTAAGLEDKTYAFVSVDVDLERPTYNALQYFYPRLSKGGVIFVHDYNSFDLEGARRAVERYEREVGGLFKVPLADRGGTLVIVK